MLRATVTTPTLMSAQVSTDLWQERRLKLILGLLALPTLLGVGAAIYFANKNKEPHAS